MPSLILIMEGFDRHVYPLGKATLFIGREGDSDIQLPCDSISMNHASIVMEKDEFVMRDNGSVNGSFVNGVKTSRCVLNHLDIVRFGNYVFLVNFQDGITEKSNFPGRQDVRIDGAKASSEGVKASPGISLKLTEPVGLKDSGKPHVKMMLDLL